MLLLKFYVSERGESTCLALINVIIVIGSLLVIQVGEVHWLVFMLQKVSPWVLRFSLLFHNLHVQLTLYDMM